MARSQLICFRAQLNPQTQQSFPKPYTLSHQMQPDHPAAGHQALPGITTPNKDLTGQICLCPCLLPPTKKEGFRSTQRWRHVGSQL